MPRSISAPVGRWEDPVVTRKRGNRKEDIVAIQTLLTNAAAATGKKGFDPNGIDGGIYKAPRVSGTLKAIEAFQKQFMRTPDLRVDPGGTTLQKLMVYAARPASPSAIGKSNGKYFSHPDASKVALAYGDRARKMVPAAEELLKSILAASGILSARLTSTKRTYHDQARITMTQTLPNSGETTVKRWYGQDVLDACKLYKKTDDIQAFADWWEARDKKRGRVSSKHLSNQALDVVPAKDRLKFVKQVRALVPVVGSGVKRIIAKGELNEPVDHVEFTFKVCP